MPIKLLQIGAEETGNVKASTFKNRYFVQNILKTVLDQDLEKCGVRLVYFSITCGAINMNSRLSIQIPFPALV